MKIILPRPPSLNHYYVTNRYTGARVKGSAAQEWFKEAGYLLKRPKKPYEGQVSLYVIFHCCGRGDYDSILKPIGDLFQEMGFIKDDDQITFAQITKVKVKTRKEQNLEIEIPEF